MNTEKRYSIQDILSYIPEPYRIVGKTEGRFFMKIKSILEADEEALVFASVDRKDKQELVMQTKALIIICDPSISIDADIIQEKCLIMVDDPKITFARIVWALFKKTVECKVHPTAFVHPDAQVNPNTYIGPFSYIGRCVIGAGTIIHGHAHLYDNVKIGENVVIHAGSVIGADGFGYLKTESGEYENFPHIGGVVIEDNVEIGANTCVDRGALGDTIIKRGAKIDNLVHIAHNVEIGQNALVIAQSMIGGSTKIGKGVWIAPCACLRDGISVGEDAIIGMGAVVTKNIPAGETWAGVPAKPHGKVRYRADISELGTRNFHELT
jgi:UDP-3-O-[3-hydroxymyristoyl] glucosamine N-acyltransferase